jgi:hypothetical protein
MLFVLQFFTHFCLEISSPWSEARSVVMANRQREAMRVWATLKKMLAMFYERPLLQVGIFGRV